MAKNLGSKFSLSRHPSIIAGIIVIILILWMLSGDEQVKEAPSQAEKTEILAKVQVKKMLSQRMDNSLLLYGRTEANRSVEVKSQVKGNVVEVLVERGARVKSGQAIAKIDDRDLKQSYARAKALLKQRDIEYSAAKSLNSKGLQGEAQLAAASANLAAIKADVEQLKLDLSRTLIVAPFEGVVDQRYVELGDYLKSGDPVAHIADLNPLVVRAYATETQVSQLSVGQNSKVSILNSDSAQGSVRYIASVADTATNTFKVEVAIENADYSYLAGVSGEVDIELSTVNAIKMTPALLALDENGNIGVKSVENNLVVFTPIDIVKTESDGVWLSGLGESVDVIVLGAGFVRSGDPVEVISAEQVKKMAEQAMASGK